MSACEYSEENPDSIFRVSTHKSESSETFQTAEDVNTSSSSEVYEVIHRIKNNKDTALDSILQNC